MSDEDKKNKKIKCPHWDKSFTAQGLGGHKAKAHKGMNKEYKRKMEIRNGNKNNLEILRLAQFRYMYDRNMLDMRPSLIPRSQIISYKASINSQIEKMQREQFMTRQQAISKIQEYQNQLREPIKSI